jgi:hypothetical protein
MTPELKEYLYRELMGILQSLEDRDINGAMIELEYLINKIKFDQL